MMAPRRVAKVCEPLAICIIASVRSGVSVVDVGGPAIRQVADPAENDDVRAVA